MPRRKKQSDYGTGIPLHEVEALAELLYPYILDMFEQPGVQEEFQEWLDDYSSKHKEGGPWGTLFLYIYIWSRYSVNPNKSPITKKFGFTPFGANGVIGFSRKPCKINVFTSQSSCSVYKSTRFLSCKCESKGDFPLLS